MQTAEIVNLDDYRGRFNIEDMKSLYRWMAINYLPNAGAFAWIDMGGIAKAEFGEAGFEVFCAAYETAADFSIADLRRKWADCPSTQTKNNVRDWAAWASANGWSGRLKLASEAYPPPPPPVQYTVPIVADPVPEAVPLTFFNECQERAPKRWLVKGVFAKGENSSIFGAPGSLKSAFLSDAAVHIAAGKDWRGFKSKERCGVVYFAFERADQVRRRLAAYALRDGLSDLPVAVASTIVDMLNPSCVDIIVGAVRAAESRFGIPVGLIIFDTWSKGIAAGGGDEDKAKDQNLVAANLRRIHEQIGVHIAGIGHSGKDETRGERGSNARQGDVDLQIQITGDSVKTATVIKANDQPDGPLTSFDGEIVNIGKDEDGDDVTAFILSTHIRTPIPVTRKRNPRHDLAMTALYRAVGEHGVELAGPIGVVGKAVATDRWRDEMFSCGVLASDAANPRADFKRIRDALAVAGRITERDGFIWPISAAPPLPTLG